MKDVRVKRIYEAAAESDGQRVLVDRLWPRGISKKAAALDLWAKDVAPTGELRKWFDHRPERFAEFARRYRDELASNSAFAGFRDFALRSKTTLLFGAKDLQINHAVVLVAALEAGC